MIPKISYSCYKYYFRKPLQAETVTPEHREIVTFVTSGWEVVKSEIEQGNNNSV